MTFEERCEVIRQKLQPLCPLGWRASVTVEQGIRLLVTFRGGHGSAPAAVSRIPSLAGIGAVFRFTSPATKLYNLHLPLHKRYFALKSPKEEDMPSPSTNNARFGPK